MKKVSIYTTPTCSYCREAKEFFKDNSISYEEYNVLTDMDKRKEMIEKSGQMGVPVIVIGDDLMVGFDRDKMSELLGISS